MCGQGAQGDVPDGPASGERDEFADVSLMLPGWPLVGFRFETYGAQAENHC